MNRFLNPHCRQPVTGVTLQRILLGSEGRGPRARRTSTPGQRPKSEDSPVEKNRGSKGPFPVHRRVGLAPNSTVAILCLHAAEGWPGSRVRRAEAGSEGIEDWIFHFAISIFGLGGGTWEEEREDQESREQRREQAGQKQGNRERSRRPWGRSKEQGRSNKQGAEAGEQGKRAGGSRAGEQGAEAGQGGRQSGAEATKQGAEAREQAGQKQGNREQVQKTLG